MGRDWCGGGCREKTHLHMSDSDARCDWRSRETVQAATNDPLRPATANDRQTTVQTDLCVADAATAKATILALGRICGLIPFPQPWTSCLPVLRCRDSSVGDILPVKAPVPPSTRMASGLLSIADFTSLESRTTCETHELLPEPPPPPPGKHIDVMQYSVKQLRVPEGGGANGCESMASRRLTRGYLPEYAVITSTTVWSCLAVHKGTMRRGELLIMYQRLWRENNDS